SLAGIAVVAGYIAEQYERARNHLAAAEAWTITASTILHVAERESLPAQVYEPVLRLLGIALDRNLDAFTEDLVSSENLMVSSLGIAAACVCGARVSVRCGWLAAAVHRREFRGAAALAPAAIRELLGRELAGMRVGGEVDWPAMMLLARYAGRRL